MFCMRVEVSESRWVCPRWHQWFLCRCGAQPCHCERAWRSILPVGYLNFEHEDFGLKSRFFIHVMWAHLDRSVCCPFLSHPGWTISPGDRPRSLALNDSWPAKWRRLNKPAQIDKPYFTVSFVLCQVSQALASGDQADYGPLVTGGDFHSVVGDRERAVGTCFGFDEIEDKDGQGPGQANNYHLGGWGTYEALRFTASSSPSLVLDMIEMLRSLWFCIRNDQLSRHNECSKVSRVRFLPWRVHLSGVCGVLQKGNVKAGAPGFGCWLPSSSTFQLPTQSFCSTLERTTQDFHERSLAPIARLPLQVLKARTLLEQSLKWPGTSF